MITDYVSSLFPDMTSFQLKEAASIYQKYGTPIEQAALVYGDCESSDIKFGRIASESMLTLL